MFLLHYYLLQLCLSCIYKFSEWLAHWKFYAFMAIVKVGNSSEQKLVDLENYSKRNANMFSSMRHILFQVRNIVGSKIQLISNAKCFMHTPGLPKCPKMAVTEIGHVIEHFHRCQNVPFIFSLLNWDILASATRMWPNRCKNAKNLIFWTFWQFYVDVKWPVPEGKI